MTNAEFYKTKEKAVRAFKKHSYFGESNEMIDWLFEEYNGDDIDSIVDDMNERELEEFNDTSKLIRDLMAS